MIKKKNRLNEVKKLLSVRHRRIIHIYGMAMNSESIYIVMELKSRNLREDISFMDWKLRFRAAFEATKGLAILHAKGFVHQDCKTCNILVNETNDQIYWADLGPPANVSSQGSFVEGNVTGNMGYMPPECINNYSVSIKNSKSANVFAFGVILGEFVSDKPSSWPVVSGVQYLSAWLLRSNEASFDYSIQVNTDEGNMILSIAKECLEGERTHRPTMSHIIETFYSTISQDTNIEVLKSNSTSQECLICMKSSVITMFNQCDHSICGEPSPTKPFATPNEKLPNYDKPLEDFNGGLSLQSTLIQPSLEIDIQILKAMRKFPSSANIQKDACGALWNLAKNVANRATLTSEGADDEILKAMKAFPDHAENQRPASGSLRNLAVNADNQVTLMTKCADDVILKAMKAFPENTEI